MKKYLTAAAILALSAGIAVAQTPPPKGPPTTSNGIGADVRAKAHAQHDSADKGIGAEVSTQARSQRPEPTPTPSPSPTPTPTSAPVGPGTR